MNRKGKAFCALVLVQLLAWGVFVPTADAGGLKRLSAQFRRFAGDADETTAALSSTPSTGGIQIYTKTFNVPTPKTSGQQPVVFVTIAAVLFTTGGFSHFSCEVDGAFCNAGRDPFFGTSGAGWVITEIPLDSADQLRTFEYTWCAKVAPGTHTVSLRMASDGSSVVDMWNAHFYIDRTEFKASTADDCELGAS